MQRKSVKRRLLRFSRQNIKNGEPDLDLNAEQKKIAVQEPKGHFLLKDVAGSGKTSVGIEEPALFSEPGLFLVRPDGTLYWSAVQTMPFSRPHFADVLTALDFVIDKNYPARGEVMELPQAAE